MTIASGEIEKGESFFWATVDPRFNKYSFQQIPWYIEQISRSLHFWLWKLSYNLGLTNINKFSLYQTKALVFSSNFIMDLVNRIILSFEVYLQLLNNWNLSNFQCMQWFEIRIEKHFLSMPRCFQSHCSYSYIVITLRHIVKNGEFKEEKWPPKRPSRSEIFTALELLRNCSLFEEEQVALHLRSHVEKFSVLYENTLQTKKQQTKTDMFFTPTSIISF